MPQRTDTIELAGGLDMVSAAPKIAPGRAVGALNYECVVNGYRRAGGYERFDGRPLASSVEFQKIAFSTGTAAIAAGQTVQGQTSTDTGLVLEVALESGSYGAGTAAGYLLLLGGDGLLSGENLRVGGVTKAKAASNPEPSPDDDYAAFERWMILAQEAQRATIGKPAGSGPIRGLGYLGGFLYAIRTNAGGTADVIHKATPSGWQPIAPGRLVTFTSGGTAEIVPGNTVTGHISGATGVVAEVVLQNGTWAAGTAGGYLVLSAQTGTFVAEDLDVGATLNVATVAGNSSAIALPPGGSYKVRSHNFYGASNLRRLYFASGVGNAFAFDGASIIPIVTGMPDDRPTAVAILGNCLGLAFPGGSLQGSQPGEPLSWDAVLGASEIGMGSDVTDMIEASGTATIIFCADKVGVLYGHDPADFDLQTLNATAGGLENTAAQAGTTLYMDRRGLRSITASQSYGNFSVGALSDAVQPLIERKAKKGARPVACLVVKSLTQYRLFFDDKTGINFFLGRKQAEAMPFELPVQLGPMLSVETDEGEALFAGGDDGFVYKLDSGASFDGAAVTGYVRLAYWHLKSPALNKRFHRADVELDAASRTTIALAADFNYADSSQPTAEFTEATIFGAGGIWDDFTWDEFVWSSPDEGAAPFYFDGAGRNVSVLIITRGSAIEEPHTLQTLALTWSPRGAVR